MFIRACSAVGIVIALLFCDASADEQSSTASRRAATPDLLPNIVVILADDLGWNSVGYQNKEFLTPHIDSLVASGITLNRFYVAPMCSPTRAGVLTGRYPIRFGCARAVIPPYRDFGLPTSEVTLAEMLSTLGYENRGIFGKWHLGHRRAKWHPLAQGFTHFHGHYNGAIDYFDLSRDDVRDWHVGYDALDEKGYATDLIADAAAKWIKQSAASDAPYFCYVPFNAPHSPFQAPDDAIELYGNLSEVTGRDNKHREIYKAMIGRMDEGIGRILDSVEASGESENTVVWFFSDNGGVGKLRGINKPLKGSKLTVFEGGIRVPACVRWPAKIAAGRSTEVVCGYIDILPTLVAVAGGQCANFTEKPIDGIDLTSVLEEPGSTVVSRPWFSYHGQSGPSSEHLAIIDKGWKLVVNGPQLTDVSQLRKGAHLIRLFHLEQDLNETNNLAREKPKKVNQLAEQLVDHRALQPPDAVLPYGIGQAGFVPPPLWSLDPTDPDQLVGRHETAASK
ncbi:sulfatase-like hydrolase/transferase [Bremerella alba]|uniref:Arylsulfatase n=1 Tax=Bremerella alba TaxID=980252 RepID=A0A7V9A5T7_9BACT|nr:sulfatase-like hydrolase/transferase [Bremerella alba]MBA2113573.1 Arylsulfatase [Bremerella alba]